MNKVKLFLLPTPMHLSLLVCLFVFICLFVCFSSGVLEFIIWKLEHPQRIYHPQVTTQPGVLQIFPDHSWEKLEPVHRLLQGTQLRPRSVCLLPDAQVGKISSRSPGIWYLDPIAPTKALLLIDGCPMFLLLSREIKERYLIALWWWHHIQVLAETMC